MRLRISLAMLCLTMLCAAPAWALYQYEFALAPQAGMVTLPGALGGLFAADFGYGAGVTYGVTDLIAVEADFIYSLHQEMERNQTGRLNLAHFLAGIGPRLNWNTSHGVPYLGLLAEAGFMTYKARWQAGGDTMRDEQDAHSFGGALAFGYDFYIADSLTIGLSGRAGYLFSNLEYRHKDNDDGSAGGYAYLAGLLRLTLLF